MSALSIDDNSGGDLTNITIHLGSRGSNKNSRLKLVQSSQSFSFTAHNCLLTIFSVQLDQKNNGLVHAIWNSPTVACWN